jgi:aminoglycoside phosphotransferase family enzyme/predicted kinase
MPVVCSSEGRLNRVTVAPETGPPATPPLPRALAAAVGERGGAEPPQMRETHASWVVLAGARAWKVKKPLVFAFLDQSTPQRRKAACEAELALNRPLAPDLYLAVRGLVPAGEGAIRIGDADDPEAVDYAVEMRRFDERDTLAGLIARDALQEHHLRAVAERLVAFHAAAPVATEPASAPGSAPAAAAAALARLDRNGEELIALLEDGGRRAAVLAQLRCAAAFACAQAGALAARVAAGRVRELHGDLRAEHVLPGPPVRFVDRLEFNRAWREVDAADELAFLTMDLTALGRPDAARALLAAYREAGGDAGDDRLVAFHAVYRAHVRAKVTLLRAVQEGEEGGAGPGTGPARDGAGAGAARDGAGAGAARDEAQDAGAGAGAGAEAGASEEDRTIGALGGPQTSGPRDGQDVRAAERDRRRADGLLAVAERCVWRLRLPAVLVVCGPSASGKSVLAAELGRRSGRPVLSSDVVRKRLAGVVATARAGEHVYSEEMSAHTYAELGRAAAAAAQTSEGAIVDATFRRRTDRDAFARGLGEGRGGGGADAGAGAAGAGLADAGAGAAGAGLADAGAGAAGAGLADAGAGAAGAGLDDAGAGAAGAGLDDAGAGAAGAGLADAGAGDSDAGAGDSGAAYVELTASAAVLRERARRRLGDSGRVSDGTPELAVAQLAEFEPLTEVPPDRHHLLRADRPPHALADALAAALDEQLAR